LKIAAHATILGSMPAERHPDLARNSEIDGTQHAVSDAQGSNVARGSYLEHKAQQAGNIR
jgi:hypothetical protein